MKRLKTPIKSTTLRSLAMGAMLCGAFSSAQAQFSNVYVFGDSLSDNGNQSSATNGSIAGRKVWSTQVGTQLGHSMTLAYNYASGGPGSTASGNIFAVGNGQTGDVYSGYIPGTGTQINNLIARGKGAVDPNALYLFWIGGNNVNARLTTALTSISTGGNSTVAAGVALAGITADAASAASQIAVLRAAGAKTIVVMNLPDLSITPVVKGTAASVGALGSSVIGLASSLSSTFNTALTSGLRGANVIQFDSFSFLNNIVASPASYGFTNVSDPVCGTTVLSLTATSNLCTTASNGYLFSDPLHPSQYAHDLIAQWVGTALESTVAGSGLANIAATAPLGRSGASWRTADSRMNNFQVSPFKGDRMYAGGDYSDGEVDANDQHAADANTQSFSIGFETNLGDNTLVGGSVAKERGTFDLMANRGRLVYNEASLMLYATHRFTENIYANALLSHGSMRFSSRRNVSIGPKTVAEGAEFGGTHDGVKLELGYQLRSGDLVHGPYAGVDWEAVAVDGFSEGTSVTAIAVSSQTVQQSHARVGYQMSTQMGSIKPSARLSYDYQLNDDTRSYTVGMGSFVSQLPVDSTAKKGGYARLMVGGSMSIGAKSEVSLGVTSTFNSPAGRDTALNVVFSTPL